MKTEKEVSLQEKIDALVTLHKISGEHFDAFRNLPAENSVVKTELEDSDKREYIKTAYAQGSVLIEVAADHLVAFTRTITEPLLTIAPWTCVRTILESGAIASWLLNPKIDSISRTQRSFAFRYEGLTQQVKAGRSIQNEFNLPVVIQRIDEVEKKATALGFERVLDRNGKRIGIGMKMPSTTQLVNDELNEEASYRLLSALAHAHPFALQQLSFRKGTDGNDPFLEKDIDPISISYLCNTAARAFVKPVWNKNQIFGWESKTLVNLFSYVFDTLGIRNQQERIWTY